MGEVYKCTCTCQSTSWAQTVHGQDLSGKDNAGTRIEMTRKYLVFLTSGLSESISRSYLAWVIHRSIVTAASVLDPKSLNSAEGGQ